jgi:hypothetical protein
LFAACTGDILIYCIDAFGLRTVPHGGFAAVQDDIRLLYPATFDIVTLTLNFATPAWRSS